MTTRIPSRLIETRQEAGVMVLSHLPIRIRRFVLPRDLVVWEELINRPDIRLLEEYLLGESVYIKYAINGRSHE